MTGLTQFCPDVIVETTSVCDRQCAGCYAPNLVSKETPEALVLQSPELFLSPENLRSALAILSENRIDEIRGIAFRGGEPSLHPLLPLLLKAASAFTDTLYLETHGRWVSAAALNQPILTACKMTGAIVKLSFDQMHGLESQVLRQITEILSSCSVRWLIAITETDFRTFQTMRAKCPWAGEDKFIFQSKAQRTEDLLRPTLAVIHVNGQISETLTSKLFQGSKIDASTAAFHEARA